MRLEVISDEAGLARLAPSWQVLAETCPTATVFQTYEWNAAWWRHFGSRWGRHLHVIAWREAGQDQLVGLAPLLSDWWHGLPIRRLMFLGSGSSDYQDVLALPGYEDKVAQAFYTALNGRIADLSQLRMGGLLHGRPPGSEARMEYVEAEQEACPFLPLADDWETTLRCFGKKTRSNIGYYDRAIRKVFEVQMSLVSNDAVLEQEMSSLFALHQRRWNQRWLPGVFGSPRVQAFHRDVARSLLSRDFLRLFTLKLDGETQAALYCFAFGDRLCYYQGGFEPTFSKWSLGTVLTAYAMQTAVSEGRTMFDFLRGDEPYKAKWTSQSAINYRRLVLPAHSMAAPLARWLFQTELDMERRLKAWMRRKTM